MLRLNVFLFLLITMSGSYAQSDKYLTDLSGLISEELSFAKTSIGKGIKTAFLTYLADDGIIFRPDIVNGKEWYSDQPASGAVLNWDPVFADISLSAEMGYTTGPWEYSKENQQDVPDQFGQYVSIWKKQNDGLWKVVVDVGITHQAVESFRLDKIYSENVQHPSIQASSQDKDIGLSKSALLKTDIEFAQVSSSEGFINAFLAFADENIRLYRSSHLPVVGKVEALEVLDEKEDVLTWNPHTAEVSESGELGYTYGILEVVTKEQKDNLVKRSNYLRIWKQTHSGKWKLVLDITNPLPD
jgi:ketosteroid isomerase-like protein